MQTGGQRHHGQRPIVLAPVIVDKAPARRLLPAARRNVVIRRLLTAGPRGPAVLLQSTNRLNGMCGSALTEANRKPCPSLHHSAGCLACSSHAPCFVVTRTANGPLSIRASSTATAPLNPLHPSFGPATGDPGPVTSAGRVWISFGFRWSGVVSTRFNDRCGPACKSYASTIRPVPGASTTRNRELANSHRPDGIRPTLKSVPCARSFAPQQLTRYSATCPPITFTGEQQLLPQHLPCHATPVRPYHREPLPVPAQLCQRNPRQLTRAPLNPGRLLHPDHPSLRGLRGHRERHQVKCQVHESTRNSWRKPGKKQGFPSLAPLYRSRQAAPA